MTNKIEKQFPVKFVGVLASLLIVLIAGFLWVMGDASKHSRDTGFQDFLGIGGDFTLTDQQGLPFDTRSIEQPYRLIYFGFTYCPAICPTELQKISAVLDTVPAEISAQIQPIFVTVDPERDTSEVLKDYLSLFTGNFIGLTGSVDEIEAVKDIYKIYAAKIHPEGASEYTVDHSSYIYLMDEDMNALKLYKINDTEETMINSIQEIIG